MAISNNDLSKGKRFLTNLKSLKFIPYENDGEDNETLSKSDSYTFDTLLADSVSVQNDDPTTNQRDSETKDEPALQNTVLGSFQFAATSLDVQDDILEQMLGWAKGGSSDTDVLYAPTSYKPLYGMVILSFNSSKNCFVIPRLRLNSKLVIASLKTSSGQIDIAGTAYAGKLTIGGTQVETPIASVPEEKLTTVVPELAGA